MITWLNVNHEETPLIIFALFGILYLLVSLALGFTDLDNE